jgi:DNA helicase-2/ATP-dependent DNA helicase PcrA
LGSNNNTCACSRSLQQLPIWITNLKHYFIDEYQDFNKAEQSFIFFLSAQATSVVIVGDDNQSLYRTRGGFPEGLRSFYANPSYDHISLVRCFRCREAIVTAANIFQTSMHTTPRVMLPTKDNGEVFVFRFKSSKAELVYLTEFLRSCIAEMPQIARPKDGTVCLFPSWRVLNAYYEELAPIIPCIRRKTDIQANRLWLDRILHLVCTPNQRFLERLLLNDYGEIKRRHKRLIIQKVVQRDIPVLSAVQSLMNDGALSGRAAEQLGDFSQLVQDTASQDADRIAQHIARKLAIDNQTVQAHISAILARLDEPDKEELIAEFCDLILPESANPPEDPRSILFLTMHGSKGLTRKNVVMPGLEAAWLPGAATGSDLDEKKRLFYVALTRATDRVLITFPRNRGRNDSLNFTIPGRGDPSPLIADAGLYDRYHP